MATRSADLVEGRRVKAIQFVPDRALGGMQQVADLLAETVSTRGIDAPVEGLDRFIPRAESDRSPWRAVALLRSWLGLVRYLRHGSFEAVVAHAPKTSIFVCTAARVAGVQRRLVVQHTPATSLPALQRQLLFLMSRLGMVTDVVFVGEEVRRSFARAPAVFLTRSHVIRNAVKVHPDHRRKTRSGGEGSGRPLRALFVGRLVSGKNVETLIKSISGLPRDVVHLRVAGDGPDLEDLRRLAIQCRSDVEFLGAVVPAEIRLLMAESDVLLFPTSGTEGLPLVLLEALEVGLPVISSDIAPSMEVLGPEGMYCPPTDVAAWRDALLRCQRDRATLVSAADKLARRRQLFSVEQMVSGYVGLLKAPGA